MYNVIPLKITSGGWTEEVNSEKGFNVQLTIDAAIGGFAIPFLQACDIL